MKIHVITLFPEMFAALNYGIVGRAQNKHIIDLHFWNPRDYAPPPYRQVDDRPFGGGPGMVMKVEPLCDAIAAAKKASEQPHSTRVVFLAPEGKPLTQEAVQHFAEQQELILVAGRYEGIDERVIQHSIDEIWSVGDYVVSGGELPIMLLVDAMTRLLPGALHHPDAAKLDSFTDNLLDYPHYTRPAQVYGISTPEVLLTGHHKDINRWRLKQSLGKTWQKRPDLLKRKILSQEELELLDEFIRESS